MVIFRFSILIVGILFWTAIPGLSQNKEDSIIFDKSHYFQKIDPSIHNSMVYATVFIFRPNQFYQWAMNFGFDLGNKICVLELNTFFSMYVPLGEVTLPYGRDFSFIAETNKTYYLEAKPSGFSKPFLKYKLVSEASIQQALNKARPAKCQDK